ncbi:MAG: alpha-N-arabinofuranosidase [Bryobacteraceae bacterium]|nr:alpha-N-arabinofuranosidase [Bryobacteraceae bacterium]
MRRRDFLKAGALGLAPARAIWAADAEIDLRPDSPGETISPHIYGHFIEHLGGVIYDGIWVGTNSKIANVGGIRKSFADDMKRIGAPNLRWPGGCFADGYHWRDGIGPPAKRPRTYNYWEAQMPPGTSATEPNHFGTHEFIRLCRYVGAEPYLAANVGSGTPKEFHDWVGYANAPAGTLSLADERAANGDREPFGVKYWGVGNESWGCGGQMTPGEYATLYRLYTAQAPSYVRPFLVACGPRGHSADYDMGWTTGFFEGMQGTRGALPDGFALHYYTDFRPGPVVAEASDARQWYAVLHSGQRIDEIIERHWEEMGRFDRNHRTRFVIDEWGTWYSPKSERLSPGYILSQTMTLRDALHAAMTFDIFNRHAEKIAMANIAQTINCLHSLFMAQGDKYVRTPVYYVFDMYRPHMNGRLVPMTIKVADREVPLLDGSGKLAGIAGSASLRERALALTLTNPSTEDSVTARIRFSGGMNAAEGRGTVLAHADPQAANTFAKPGEVVPSELAVTLSGGVATVTLPKQSAAALTFRMT